MKKFLSLFAALLMVGSMMGVHAAYYVAHNAVLNSNSWNPAGDEMTEREDFAGVYEITFTNVPAQQVQFKVTNGTWSSCYNAIDAAGSGVTLTNPDNVCFTLAEAGDVVIRFDARQNVISVNPTADPAELGPDVYTIVGVAGLCGTGWDLNNANNEMTEQEDGTYLLVIEGLTLADGNYDYKVAKNHAWTWCLPQSGNQILTIETGGEYNVTFVLNLTSNTLTATAELQQEVEVTHTYALAGSFNEWGTPVAFEGNSLTYNLAAGQYDVKIVVDGTYKGYSEIFNAECSSEGASQSDAQWNNIRFTLAEAADITVTIGEDGLACFEAPFYVRTIVRETLTFHAGAVAEADPVFFVMTSLGAIPAEGNPNTDETIEMVAGENGVYTAEIDNESQSFYIVRCAPGAESIQWYQDAENPGNVWNGTGWVAKSATEFWFAGYNAENGWIMDLTTEAPVQTYTLTVTDAGWATMFLPFATEAVEGTTIYTGVLNAANTALVLTAHEQVPVNTPVLVQAEAGEYVFTEIADFIGLAETSLYGVTEATAYSTIAEETGKTVLTLGVDENEAVGFHAPSNAAGSLPANKCCLLYEGAADASIRLVFNEATGLEMNAEQVAAIKKIVNGTVFVIRNGQMFDLNGRIVK